jgi:cytochrome c5
VAAGTQRRNISNPWSTRGYENSIMSKEQDAIFVRNTGLVLGVLVVFAIIVGIIANVLHAGFMESQVTETMIAERLAPVGRVNVGTEPLVVATAAPAASATETADAAPADAAAADEADIGQQVYDKICFACHTQGVAGAPKIGDAAGWGDRLDKGTETLVKNAIEGFQGDAGMMPPRGGMGSLSDEEIRASVIYMLETVGTGDESPGAAAGTEAAPVTETETPAHETDVAPEAAMEATAAPETAETPAAAETGAALGRGKEVYDAACFVCHTTGAAGAPKFGDAAAWSARIATGADVLYDHAVNGYMGDAGLMPPKGGRPDFSDDDVKAAVDYMVDESQ